MSFEESHVYIHNIYIYNIYIIKRHISLNTWVWYVLWWVSYIYIYIYIYIIYNTHICTHIYLWNLVLWQRGVSHMHEFHVTLAEFHVTGGERGPHQMLALIFEIWYSLSHLECHSFNRNLRTRSPLSRVDGTWQKRPREREHQLRFEIEETTLQMQ